MVLIIPIILHRHPWLVFGSPPLPIPTIRLREWSLAFECHPLPWRAGRYFTPFIGIPYHPRWSRIGRIFSFLPSSLRALSFLEGWRGPLRGPRDKYPLLRQGETSTRPYSW